MWAFSSFLKGRIICFEVNSDQIKSIVLKNASQTSIRTVLLLFCDFCLTFDALLYITVLKLEGGRISGRFFSALNKPNCSYDLISMQSYLVRNSAAHTRGLPRAVHTGCTSCNHLNRWYLLVVVYIFSGKDVAQVKSSVQSSRELTSYWKKSTEL